MKAALLSTWLLAPLLFAQPTPVDGGVPATRRGSEAAAQQFDTTCNFEPDPFTPRRETTKQRVRSGPLGTSDLLEVIGPEKAALLECARVHRTKEPLVSGKVVMKWTIQPTGKTSDVAVETEEFQNSYFATCVSQRIKRWNFPRPEKPQAVSFPFKF